MTVDQDYSELIDRVIEAQNSHDADQVAELVAEDYQSETPLHPERDFTGREQVRRNWQAVFESVPDFQIELLRSAVDGDTIWLEVHLTGTQTDGTELDMRGGYLGCRRWAPSVRAALQRTGSERGRRNLGRAFHPRRDR